MTINTKTFGELAISAENDLYEDYTLSLGGKDVTFHLHIFEGFLNDETAKIVKHFLDNFPALYDKARAYIAEQTDESDEDIDFFYRDGIEETDEDYLLGLFGVDNTEKITKEMYLAALELRGSHIWMNDKNAIGCVLDFSLNEEYTDELLAVSFNDKLEPLYIAHES